MMLADIFPTGYHATELAGLKPGESIVIYAAGPVGPMAAYSAMIRGAYQVMVVDTPKDRLALAETIGAIPVDDTEQDAVEQVLELTQDGIAKGDSLFPLEIRERRARRLGARAARGGGPVFTCETITMGPRR